jgi:hypothetical protein
MDMSLKEKAKKIFDPLKWGLRLKAINDLGKQKAFGVTTYPCHATATGWCENKSRKLANRCIL